MGHQAGGHSHGGPTGQGPASQDAPPGINCTDSSDSVPSYESYDGHRDHFDDSYVVKNGGFNPSTTDQQLQFEIEKYAADSEMPVWFQVFYTQYVRQREEMREMITVIAQKTGIAPAYQPVSEKESCHFDFDDPEEQPIDPQKFRIMNLNITLLEGGILFHSIFVGMTISITTDGFIALLVAIVFHQSFEGLGLGSRIAAIPYKKKALKPWVLVCAFGLTCPIGQIVGLATRNTYDPSSAFALILVGFFNAFSSGLLIYAALVDLLAEDFLSEEADRLMTKKDKAQAFITVLLGAAGMSIVGAFA